MTYNDLELSLVQTLEDMKEEILASEYPEDFISEQVDSHIPIYSYQLLEIAMDKLDLATEVPEIDTGYGENATAVNIIASNISTSLSTTAFEWFEDYKK